MLRFVLLIFLLVSCDQKKALLVIDVQEGVKQAVISEIADKVKAIPLETTPECLLGDISSLRMDDSLLFINSNGEIFLFTSDGKFLKKIISKGKGSGEIINVKEFVINKTKKQLFVLGTAEQTICCEYDGTIVSQKRFIHPYFSIMTFTFFNDSIWAVAWGNNVDKNKNYDIWLVKLNDKWELQDSVKLYTPDISSHIVGFGYDFFSVVDQKIFLNAPSTQNDRIWRDTLYCINRLHVVPTLRLDYGQYSYRENTSNIFEQGYPISTEAIRINKRFLFTSYYDQKEEPYAYYSFCYDFVSGKKYNIKDGFEDDIYHTSGELYLRPVDVYNNEYFYYKDSDELPETFTERNEFDNPVLFIVTLKK